MRWKSWVAWLVILLSGFRLLTDATGPPRPAVAQASSLSIRTDYFQYLVGQAIQICYKVPGPGRITITDVSSLGTTTGIYSVTDDGTGDCIHESPTAPPSTECLRIDYTGNAGSESNTTCFQVHDSSTILPPFTDHDLTVANANFLPVAQESSSMHTAINGHIQRLNSQYIGPCIFSLTPIPTSFQYCLGLLAVSDDGSTAHADVFLPVSENYRLNDALLLRNTDGRWSLIGECPRGELIACGESPLSRQ